MKSGGMKATIVDIKEYSSKEVGLLVQAIFTEVMIIFGIISLISDKFLPSFYIIMSILMFTMAYNNKKIYKKKYLTKIYIIVGFFVAITTFWEYIL